MAADAFLRVIRIRHRFTFVCRMAIDTTLFAKQRDVGMLTGQMNTGTFVTSGTGAIGHRMERAVMAGGASVGEQCVSGRQLAGAENPGWRRRETGLPALNAGRRSGQQRENEKSEKDDACQREPHDPLTPAERHAVNRRQRRNAGFRKLDTRFDLECQVDTVIRFDDLENIRTNVEGNTGGQSGSRLHMPIYKQDGVGLAGNFQPIVHGPSYRGMSKLDSVVRQMNHARPAPPDFQGFARNATFLAGHQPLVAANSVYDQAAHHRLPIDEDGGDVRN